MCKFGTIVALLALLALPVWAGSDQSWQLKAGEESAFAIPRMSAPPTLDGKIDAAEWRDSAAISGMLENGTDYLDARPATFFLAWDAGHIYMACRVYLPPGYKLRLGGGRAQDGADCFDDGLELLFKPLGKNVSSRNERTEFKLNISGLGYGGTYTRLAVGQIMKTWEPEMHTATRVTEQGTAPMGGAWWELEAAFSNKDFELIGDNRAGDQWRMMLGINHMPNTTWMQARIPCIGSYFTPQGKTLVTLVETTPTVQMMMESLPNLASDGTASLVVKAHNPSPGQSQVKVSVDVAGKIVKDETLDVPAGGDKTFSLNEKLPESVREGRFNVHAAEGQNTLLSYTAVFKVGQFDARIRPVPAPKPDEFSFAAKFNPVRGQLQITADSFTLPDPAAVKSLSYTITNKTSGKTVASGEITRVTSQVFEDVLTLKDLEAGAYEVTSSLLLKDGKSYGPRTGTFEKKDEAKAFPEWWGKDPGDSERVIPPFTAIDRKGSRLSCWGRSYELSSLGLPKAVASQDGKVMAAPARVVVVSGGKETVINLGSPVVTDATGWRVRFSGKAEGAGLAFSAQGWMEQDGMVSVDLTYQPSDGKKIVVDGLRIEYPVANDVAECLGCVGSGFNFAPISALVLSRDKQGRLWSTFDIGRKGSGMQIGSFYPYVWLGSERRGLMWWGDNDQGWFPDNDVPAHEVARENGAVVLKNNIIGKSSEVSGPRTIHFTWMASPFKPLPKGWRMYAATEDGTFFQPFRGCRTNPKTGKPFFDLSKIATLGNCNWIHPESDEPSEWSKLWAEQKAGADDHVKKDRPFDLYNARVGVWWMHQSFQLIGYGHKSIQDDVFNYFGDEWYPDGIDTWNQSYTDYAMWLLDRSFREGGVVSTYWDLSFPVLYGSLLSGLAYRLPDGRIQPGYNSLNCRRFFQRLWAIQDKQGLNPGCTGTHSTQAYIYPCIPWISAILDGERDWNLDASDMDWIDYYPTERMRALSCPHNWGVGINWMANFSSSDPNKILAAKRAQAEYVWMHDSWCNPTMTPNYDVLFMPDRILDWGLNAENATYVPYWRNVGAKSGDPNVFVSVWKMNGRVLIGVFNYDRKATKDVKLKLDLKALGFSGKTDTLAAVDLYQRPKSVPSSFDAGARMLSFKGLAPHTARFIGIRDTNPAPVAKAREQYGALLAQAGVAPSSLPETAMDMDLIASDTVYGGPDTLVVPQDAEGLMVVTWRRSDRVLFAVVNDTDRERDGVLKLDLAKLGLTPKLQWQDFLRVRDLNKSSKDQSSVLDYYGGELTVKAIAPKSARLVVVRLY